MRLSPTLEHGSHRFHSSAGFRSFFARFLGLAVALMVMLGVGVSARADGTDTLTNDVLAETFAWVVDNETAALAYEMTASVSDPELQMSLREFLLLKMWAEGGDPWSIDPNWVAPTGP